MKYINLYLIYTMLSYFHKLLTSHIKSHNQIAIVGTNTFVSFRRRSVWDYERLTYLLYPGVINYYM